MIRPVASTSVLMTGPDTTVGSIRSLVANRGRIAPMPLAHTTMAKTARETVAASACVAVSYTHLTLPTTPYV